MPETATARPTDFFLPTRREIERLNRDFENAPAGDILAWAWQNLGPRFVVLSSFGASSGALLHLAHEVAPEIPVVFLETHYHFPETIAFRDQLVARYHLTVEGWEAVGGRAGFLDRYPDDLNARATLDGVERPADAPETLRTGVDLCCWVNKVEPLQRALRGRLGFATSLRRDGGTEVRERTRILEMVEPAAGRTLPLVKVNPLANWTKRELWRYIHVNDIPVHPLFLEGYKSIGCAPCTRKPDPDGDERSGRWSGTGKSECGIHTIIAPVGTPPPRPGA